MIRTILLAVVMTGCDATIEKVQLQLQDPANTCDTDILDQIDAVVPELRGPAGTTKECLPVTDIEIKTLKGLQGELSRTTTFGDLEEGSYSIKLAGYDDNCPTPKDLLLCGFAELRLPLDGQTMSVTVTCGEGSSLPAAFTACRDK